MKNDYIDRLEYVCSLIECMVGLISEYASADLLDHLSETARLAERDARQFRVKTDKVVKLFDN